MLGAMVESGLSAAVARILVLRMMGRPNGEIAEGLGVSKQHVATIIYRHKADLIGITRLCHDCARAPVCEDYTLIPAVMATVCANADTAEER